MKCPICKKEMDILFKKAICMDCKVHVYMVNDVMFIKTFKTKIYLGNNTNDKQKRYSEQ